MGYNWRLKAKAFVWGYRDNVLRRALSQAGEAKAFVEEYRCATRQLVSLRRIP